MRHLVLAASLALLPLAAAAQAPESPAEQAAMTSLLRVCLDHAAGQPVEALVQRAQSGGFQRRPDQGGVLGESLTWRGAGQSEVRLSLRRAEGLNPAVCRIEVDHGDVDAVRLADSVVAWAEATSPAFAADATPRNDFEDPFSRKPVLHRVFRRPGSRLTVERFDRPAGGGFDSLFANQAVTITLERLP